MPRKTLSRDQEFALDDESEAHIRLAVLYRRYHAMLVRNLHRLAGSPEQAEDLAQQLWLKLVENMTAGRFLPADEPGTRAYLFAAARNLYIDECVRCAAHARTATHPEDEIERLLAEHGAVQPVPEDDLSTQERRILIGRAVAALPPAQAEVIAMWMAGESIERMAARTQAPRETVLSRKKYGFSKLRAGLAVIV
jgi:RNA polymerase sigma-70 factor, ECF subfamily